MSRPNKSFESDAYSSGTEGSAATARLRCDVLFAASREPLLIVEVNSGVIMDANPAAAGLLRIRQAQLIGAPLGSALDQQSAAIVSAGFALAQMRGGTHALNIPALRGAPALCVRVSMFRIGEKSYFLMRLGLDDAGQFVVDTVCSDAALFQLIDEAPVGFLITDLNLQIDYANRAFIAMIDIGPDADVCGKSLAHWLDLSAAELAALQRRLCQRQAVTRLKSSLHCSRNGVRHVEVQAIAVPDDQEPCWGFSVNELRLLN